MTTALEVWLDSDPTNGPTLVGMLHSDRGHAMFEYAPGWLGNPRAFALDPDLSLGKGAFFPSAETANFGVFLDSSPDRWGQTLMKRRETLDATNEGRRPRNLYAWDYLVGVQALTRQGGAALQAPRDTGLPRQAQSRRATDDGSSRAGGHCAAVVAKEN